MPDIVSDTVDVYVFRRLNARVQFLLLQRRHDVPLANTWQSFSRKIAGYESTVQTARRAVREMAGLQVSDVYSADFVNEFFDESRDVIVLAPVLAVNVSPQAPITLSAEYREAAWWDTDQALARLPFAGQRWAVRHIGDIMSSGHAESELYRIAMRDPSATPLFDPTESREVEADSVDEEATGVEVDPPVPSEDTAAGGDDVEAEGADEHESPRPGNVDR